MPRADLVQQGVDRRVQIVKFIRDFQRRNGYGPTILEIGKGVGISSPNAVRGHLIRLQDEGRIAMEPRTPRSIRVVEAV